MQEYVLSLNDSYNGIILYIEHFQYFHNEIFLLNQRANEK